VNFWTAKRAVYDDDATIVQRIQGFDGLRAVAIVAVVMWHTLLSTGFPVEGLGPLGPLVRLGWAGVDLFFTLSGFLITTLLVREQPLRLGRFYLRRALRIVPVFAAVMALDVFVFGRYPALFPSVRVARLARLHSALGVLPYVTLWGNYFAAYMQGWFSRPVHDPGEAFLITWSLSVEEHFYLLWPLALLLCRGRRGRALIAAALCLLVPLARWWTYRAGWETPQNIHSLSHYRVDSILWGALGALLCDQVRDREWLALLAGGLATAVLVIGGQLSVIPPGTPVGLALGFTSLSILGVGVILHVRNHQRSRLTRMLAWPPLAWIGQLSYAMYLVHMPMIDLGRRIVLSRGVAPTIGNFIGCVAAFVMLTAAAAAVLHYAVELPFLRLKSRVPGSPSQTG
jgi:peptidoglycan/LPS O-acetylase OafA/YrhL